MTAENAARPRTEVLGLAAILLVVVALRFIRLGADPMPELEPGFISDWGTWWKNARLHALFGRWMVDDGNYGILTAPVHTLAQRAVFGLFGVGYTPGFILAAVSGSLTVVLVWWMVRREAGGTAALVAAALLGVNVLTLAFDRSAYPESFQLMLMTAAVAAALASPGRPWLAALGGAAVALVLLSKPPGLLLAPVAAATWAAPWLMDRAEGGPRRFDARGVWWYAATAALLLAIVGVVWLRPHLEDVLLHFRSQVTDQQALGGRQVWRMPLFGSRLGFRINGFFRHEWYLLLPAAIFAAARVTRIARRRLTTLEVAGWIWLVMGLGAMSLIRYQQDRRFLFLVPPLAILTALALSQAFELGESAWRSARAKRLGYAAGAVVLALAAGLYIAPHGAGRMMALGRMMGREWREGVAAGVVLSAGIVVAAIVAALWTPTLRWRGNRLAQLALAVLAVVIVGARTGSEVLHLRRGLEGVSRGLDRISATWPDSERVALGWSAGTVTLASRLIPLNHELREPRAAERFHPQLELYAASTGAPVTQSPIWATPGMPARVDCATFPVWDDAQGRPKLEIHVFVAPERLEACRAAAGTP